MRAPSTRVCSCVSGRHLVACPHPSTFAPPPPQAREWGFNEVADSLVAWANLQGQERIKEEFPNAAANFVPNGFVSADKLLANTRQR